MTGKRTNFLLFVTDQQRADHIGAYGNGVVATPNLDALAARGWRFGNAHVATPICMPNRASLMTGRYPSAHGARHNGIPLSLTSNTFVDTLRRAGYRTTLVGKAHLQNMTDIPPSWPVDPACRLPAEARSAPPGRYDQENRNKWLTDDAHGLDYPFYGFEQVDLVDDHSDLVHGDYRRWLRRCHPGAETLIGPEHALPAPEYELTRIHQAWRTRLPEELYPTTYIAERTIEQLRSSAGRGEPFFLQCSFPDPHHPFTPPGRFWDMYRPEDMPLPPSFHAPGEPPPHVRWLHEQRDRGTAVRHTPALFACTEREAREAIALNYGAISHIDEQIGRVLAELRALGLEDDTVVIFTSDHGDYLGEHQLLLKGPIHYRGLTRVPLIWSEPRCAGGGVVEDALLSTIDLATSILDRAGVPRYNGMQGVDLSSWMHPGRVPEAREALMIEEEGQRVILGFQSRIRCRTLLSEGWRMTVYDGAPWGELYDLASDPIEACNRWDDAGARTVRARMMERLCRSMLEHVDTSPYPDALA
ncbi:sulfatase-like hydrolase/transferase [Verticiella sediminum]|uniref:Sulfatase-like hydrolase/transferase n=1 Tax=Verticiella sediminum TaxID=1247510 RepID=A0A556B241_9BURK|nr:sulfatase-like hydrolase/transferase [Verticiella sediminum]TSH99258.1 sulfatase-like hydrolase/transferase [Verticiella sediminum]